MLTAPDFEALGVYEPGAPDAAERLELLEFLVELGATAEELVSYRDELPGLASVIALRGGPALTLTDVVERSGVPEEKVRRLIRFAGFAEPRPEDRVFSTGFPQVVSAVAAAEGLFGEEAAMQLTRVMGSAIARIADAAVSAFLVNIEPTARADETPGLAVARANAEAAALLPAVGAALEVLLRQHLVAARRSVLGLDADTGYETQQLCVGFVDLVDSTALTQRLPMRELGALLTEFENVAADTVRAGGGRVVKLIGDEILYTAPDERSACRIALELAATFAAHPVIPGVRASVASGRLLLRDGDVFGPVVNLAARAVKLAPPGDVVAPTSVAAAAGIAAEPLGEHELRGFDEPLELSRLRPAGRG